MPQQDSDTSSDKQNNRPAIQDVLNELLFYFNVDTETGNITVKRHRKRSKPLGAFAPYLTKGKYYHLRICKRRIKVHHLIWITAYKQWPKYEIDHIDGNKLNNSLSNLRDVPRSINAKNNKQRSDNTSTCTNIHWHRRQQQWIVRFRFGNCCKQVGSFNHFEDAIIARDTFLKDNPYGFTNRHGQDANDSLSMPLNFNPEITLK